MRRIGLAVVVVLALGIAVALMVRALGLTPAFSPPAADAASARTIPVIGYLASEAESPFGGLNAFRQWLRDLGYVEGQTVALEVRFTDGHEERARPLATELVQLGVDVIVARSTVSALAAKQATSTIPIVFALAGDPVGSGLVASLARPGGNATGLSNLVSELSGKQLEILKAAAPQVSRIGVLYNPVNPASRVALEEARASARTLAVALEVQEIRQPNELARAFSLLRARRAGALLMISDSVLSTQVSQVSKLALQSRLPAIDANRAFPEAGGLFAYGPSFTDNLRRAAGYVDKILKGAKPADLPVQQPTTFELVINLKTAQALGLTVPQSMLMRAEEIIQ